MCGIAGIVSHQDFIPKEQFVRSILKSMNYRGPDNESLFRVVLSQWATTDYEL